MTPAELAEKLEALAETIGSAAYNADPWGQKGPSQEAADLRQAAARLRSMEEALKQLVDDLDVYHEATGKLESVVSEEAWSAARAALSKEAVT